MMAMAFLNKDIIQPLIIHGTSATESPDDLPIAPEIARPPARPYCWLIYPLSYPHYVYR
jgi:hypothetical protein